MREFKKASVEPNPKEKEDKDAIIAAAKKMGIKTEGKEASQIISEMNKQLAEKNS